MGKVCTKLGDREAIVGADLESLWSNGGDIKIVGYPGRSFDHINGKMPRYIPAAHRQAATEAWPSKCKALPTPAPSEGRRRSLLVGINYYDSPDDQLIGGVNDVLKMVPVLAKLGFPSDAESQRVLTDRILPPGHESDTFDRPTRENILNAFKWLVDGAQPGDALFFHYSGHGGQQMLHGNARESIVPMDFQSAGMLDDSEVAKELVENLPEGCRLTCIFDSCHGAGAPLALPSILIGESSTLRNIARGSTTSRWTERYEKTQQKKIQKLNDVPAEVLVFSTCDTCPSPEKTPNANSEENLCLKRIGTEDKPLTECAADKPKTSVPQKKSADGILECNEDDCAADKPKGSLYIDPCRAAGGSRWGSGGVLTSAFLEVFSNCREESPALLNVMEKIHALLRNRHNQAPLLAASRPLSLLQRCVLDVPLVGWSEA